MTGPGARPQTSAHLGRALRSILASPTRGFPRALDRDWGGAGPVLLTMLGGASAALLWLKVGALLGLREVCAPRYLAGYVVATAVLGALLALVVMPLWAFGAARVTRLAGGQTPRPAALRFVWAAASFPHLFLLLVVLPLDLLVVGSDTFTTRPLEDPVRSLWAALSIGLGLSVMVWGAWILTRGYQAATGVSTGRALVGPLTGMMCIGIVVAAFVAGARLLPEGSPCPTKPR